MDNLYKKVYAVAVSDPEKSRTGDYFQKWVQNILRSFSAEVILT